MKNPVAVRWLATLVLMLALVGAGLRLQSAQAQYGATVIDVKPAPPAMIAKGGHLFILIDGTLYKVREKDLTLANRLWLAPAAVPTAQPIQMGTALPTATAARPPAPASVDGSS